MSSMAATREALRLKCPTGVPIIESRFRRRHVRLAQALGALANREAGDPAKIMVSIIRTGKYPALPL
jgi:hypothetical protein